MAATSLPLPLPPARLRWARHQQCSFTPCPARLASLPASLSACSSPSRSLCLPACSVGFAFHGHCHGPRCTRHPGGGDDNSNRPVSGRVGAEHPHRWRSRPTAGWGHEWRKLGEPCPRHNQATKQSITRHPRRGQPHSLHAAIEMQASHPPR